MSRNCKIDSQIARYIIAKIKPIFNLDAVCMCIIYDVLVGQGCLGRARVICELRLCKRVICERSCEPGL